MELLLFIGSGRKHCLAWKKSILQNIYFEDKIFLLNNELQLLLSYQYHMKKNCWANITYVCSPPMRCNTKSQEAWAMTDPQTNASWKQFIAIPSPQTKRSVKLNAKENILLYLRRWVEVSKSMGSFPANDRDIAALHTPVARGWRVNMGTDSRKTQLPFPGHAVKAHTQQSKELTSSVL